jgi:hypothetical protein
MAQITSDYASESPCSDGGEKSTYLLLQVRSLEGHGIGKDSERNEVLMRDEFPGDERAQTRSKSAGVQIDVKSGHKVARIQDGGG